MKTRILIADDHQLIREGLINLLKSQHDIEIAGQAENGRQAVKMAKEIIPDIIIMDIGMPDMNGVQASRQIMKEQQLTKIIALSMHSNHQFVHGMFRAGAKGYILKDCAMNEIISAIKAVKDGKIYICQEIRGIVLNEYAGAEAEIVHEQVYLSYREKEILKLLAEGNSVKIIAEKLHLSIKTVETHRKNIQDKTGKKNLAELTKFAINIGLTSLN